MQQYTNDLEQRTLEIAKKIIQLVKTVPFSALNRNTCSQVLRSSSSIGANYREATEAESRADFIHKLGVCKKETRETLYWLELLLATHPEKNSTIIMLQQELKQLVRIFASSILTAKSNNSKH
jgi:four helix bundle protein